MTTNAKCGLYGIVSQGRWYKTRRLIYEIQDIEEEGMYGMYRSSMDTTRVFIVHVARAYR